ncbi:MAG: CDP-alcohol phosphatidyltransferase family protein [Polyangiaceae bacterium]|nr:CDP-alcohol phosphatidyltransferase family protein [Polyangiaceae bacterium]
MLREGFEIYKKTRKKNDQLFNHYFMRVLAGYVVAALSRTPATPNQITIVNLVLFLVATAMLVALPSYEGGLLAILVLELSYLLDCADGMLARHKGLASKAGHHFDFFTDETKAAALVVGVGLRLYVNGGAGPTWSGGPGFGAWPRDWFLFATIGAVFVISAAVSMTKFLRHPDIAGRAETVEAYYETVSTGGGVSLMSRVAAQIFTFLRFLNHYPSHIFIFALLDRFDVFLLVYVSINALYLAKGWLGLLIRFARS